MAQLMPLSNSSSPSTTVTAGYAGTPPSGSPRPSVSGNASPRSVNDNDTELRQ